MVSGRKQTYTEMFKINDAISNQPNDSQDIDSIYLSSMYCLCHDDSNTVLAITQFGFIEV